MKFRESKVGLALGSGGARGLAHIGVLEVLAKEGIPVDMIAGTSIGAIVGSLYAQGKNASQIKELALELTRHKLTHFIDPSLPKTGLIKGKKIKDSLVSFFGDDIRFSALKIPFACVATDIETGEEIILDRGSVAEAVRASISIPGIFTVVKRGGRYLVDGGLVNPVPVSLVRRMGADFIIAVNVIPGVVDRAHPAGKEGTRGSKEPNVIQVLLQSLHIGAYSLVRASLEGADVVIEPNVVHFGAGDLNHAQECILQGELAAQNSIPEIKRQLKT
ncbi:MAG: patatin-like phospholipase family protein [Dehalococcoidales bacterium]